MQGQTIQVITSIKLEEIFVISPLRNKWEKVVIYCHVWIMAYNIYGLLHYKYNVL